MQPPRPRRRREKLPGARVTYLLVLYVGSLLLAALLLRLAFDLATGTSDSFARVTLKITAPLIWLPHRLLGVSAPLSDLGLLVVLGAIWVVLLGVARGWESESRHYRRLPHLHRP